MADYAQPGSPQDEGPYTGPSPHPYLHDALLYITNVPDVMSDEHLATIFTQIGPFRPKINRDIPGPTKSGTIEFKSQAIAEKALATIQNKFIPNLSPPTRLVLSPYPPTNPPTPLPPPSAAPRIIKHLPPTMKDTDLYEIFRPFGALASIRTNAHGSAETAIVEFWSEDDARQAEEAMHCTDLDGQIISVQIYQTNRRSVSGGGVGTEFSVNAPPFVPSGGMFYPSAATYSPPRGPPSNFTSPRSVSGPLPGSPFIHGPGQQVQLAPASGPGSNSHSGLIDPCNLFIKNLDPSIDSNALFSHFRTFGRIVSARVMRNGETGESRGFGFVSFETPDQAAAAMQGMNGVQLGTKHVIVRLHEPKQLRQEKLAARFSGSNGHPRNASGATSPTISEGGDSLIGRASPRHYPSNQLGSPTHMETPLRGRRGSGSFYNAAVSGTLNLQMSYDNLATLTPVVRQEVLTGELMRRVKSLDVVPSDEVDGIVDRIVGLSLSEVVNLMDNNEKLKYQVMGLSPTADDRAPSASRSTSTSQDSRLLTPDQLNATASAPDHPSTPISMSTPPRTASPPPPVSTSNASERERIFDAVNRFESSRQQELTELLMSLPKRERAMCLFNAEVLRAKLADAKLVLESMDEEEDAPPPPPPRPTETAVPITPQPKKTVGSKMEGSPHTPNLSSRGPSAASSPMPTTPSSVNTSQYTSVASLSKLPAAEVIRLAFNGAEGLPVEKADQLVVRSTDEFIDSLVGKPVQQQKQALGDKLFKVVKSFGVKGAPKITIALLDQEDLRALAHLMNSYPAVLKEKVLAIASA